MEKTKFDILNLTNDKLTSILISLVKNGKNALAVEITAQSYDITLHEADWYINVTLPLSTGY